MIDHHAALIYTMVLVSAADREMTDAELQTIGDTVRHLPAFADYNLQNLTGTARECAELLNEEDGFEKAIDMIVNGLPARLRETAYALSCDVAASDGKVSQEELRLLEMLRHRLEVGRLPAAAIERGTRARYMKL
jgi:tellurite resistance protein